MNYPFLCNWPKGNIPVTQSVLGFGTDCFLCVCVLFVVIFSVFPELNLSAGTFLWRGAICHILPLYLSLQPLSTSSDPFIAILFLSPRCPLTFSSCPATPSFPAVTSHPPVPVILLSPPTCSPVPIFLLSPAGPFSLVSCHIIKVAMCFLPLLTSFCNMLSFT